MDFSGGFECHLLVFLVVSGGFGFGFRLSSLVVSTNICYFAISKIEGIRNTDLLPFHLCPWLCL